MDNGNMTVLCAIFEKYSYMGTSVNSVQTADATLSTQEIYERVAKFKSASPGNGISVSWAQHLDEVREVQRLRYEVFAKEMGAHLETPIPNHDVDTFDDYCEHLIVREPLGGAVIGTYRVLTPAQAKRCGSTYTETEFDISSLRPLLPRMLEVGRSCVHRDHRHGGVIMALWRALGAFMASNGLDAMMGCASIPMVENGRVSGDAAASLWRKLQATHMAPTELQVKPLVRLPIEEFNNTLDVKPPALIQGYLRLGAQVLGAPAWDPCFNTADLPILMRTQNLAQRYRSHFLGA